jgi:signal transduction histidine kinase
VEEEATVACGLRILTAGHLSDHVAHLDRVLRRTGYAPVWESGRTQSIESLPFEFYDLVLADGDSEAIDCLALVRMLRDRGCDLPYLIVSDDPREERAVAAIRAGADEWVEKARIDEQLSAAVARAIAAAEERRSVYRARREEAVCAEVSDALARVSLELVAVWGTPMLLERLGQVSADVLRCDFTSTLMLEPGGDAFEVVASHGWPAEVQEVSRFVRAPVDRMASILDRLAKEEVFELRTNSMTSVVPSHTQVHHLFTALRQEGAPIGIQLFSRRGEALPFTATDRQIAAGIAEIASLSLTTARVIDDLERAHHVKSDFVATVSHELRTPLHIVIGYTELLIDGTFGSLGSEQLQPLRRIRERAGGLLELINATLDLNRLEAGRISIDLEPTDLSELVDSLQRETGESQNNPQLRLEWEVPEGLPIISTDPAKLKVALKNLITNALKFTDSGSVTVRVVVRKEEVEFSVADTGVGIASDALPIVFEAFRQADSSSTRRYGGVGLGLYIVRRLLDLLGGRVEVESQLGKGSTFRVLLPRKSVAR